MISLGLNNINVSCTGTIILQTILCIVSVHLNEIIHVLSKLVYRQCVHCIWNIKVVDRSAYKTGYIYI